MQDKYDRRNPEKNGHRAAHTGVDKHSREQGGQEFNVTATTVIVMMQDEGWFG